MPAIPGTSAYGTRPEMLAQAVPGDDIYDEQDMEDFQSGDTEMMSGAGMNAPAQAAPPPQAAAPQSKPAFNPHQAFEKAPAQAKPAFDPNQSFDKAPAEGGEAQQKSVPFEDMSTVGGLLEGAAGALDYPGGFARGAVAAVAGKIMGKKDIVTADDLHKMVEGKGPNSAEYLRRLGFEEGHSVDLPVIGRVSERGAVGFGYDVVTDPLTAIGKAAKLLPESMAGLKKVLGLGANEGAESIGKAIYKSGFSQIDAKMIEKGQKPLSELLLTQGAPTGTTAKVQKQVTAIADTMGKMRDGLYQKATDLGVTVDLAHPLEKAESFAAELMKDKRASVSQQGAELMKYIETEFKNAGKVDLATLSQWKTDLYNTLPKTFFNQTGQMSTLGKQFNAALAHDFKTAIVEGGNAAQKGLGTAIESINSKWGTLLNAKKPLAKQAAQAAGKPIVSPLKAAITGVNPLAGGVMEAADLAKTTFARTKAGKAAISAGQSGAAGDVARRTLIKSQQPESEEE